jgi:hypothetical protein
MHGRRFGGAAALSDAVGLAGLVVALGAAFASVGGF